MSKPQSNRSYLPESELRKHFNEMDIVGQADRGELLAIVLSSPLAPPEANQPQSTVSQMVEYRRSDLTLVCLAHRYLCPDGTIGGSGRPDPKVLRIGDTLYFKS